ncbi:MAG: hypothetical protein L6R42_009370 [Xanthoria sp. 1 TBL-2021]|nr:MAG: hypothetical protein L6R42_009370 [Xanthoria sp. 1 TBL-2021]
MPAVNGYLYVVAITLAKASLLLFLYRIFHVDRRFRIATWIYGGILGIWATVTVFLAIFACRPIKASWNFKLMRDPKTKCEPRAWDVENIYGFLALEANLAIIIACLPALTPLFKRVPLLSSLIPSIRSTFSQASAMQCRPWPQKLSGPHHGVEREAALPMAAAPHTSWKTPGAWREAEKRLSEPESQTESEGSGESVMSVQAMYHAGSRGCGLKVNSQKTWQEQAELSGT